MSEIKTVHQFFLDYANLRNDGRWVIPFQIIQYFWMLTPLPLRFYSFFSLFVYNVEMINL